MKKFFTGFEFFTLCIVLFFVLIGLLGCVSATEKLLTQVNDDVNYRTKVATGINTFGNCRTTAEQKVKVLTDMGIKAELVHCSARDKYSWDHAGVKATVDGQEWFLDNGTIMDVPWKYAEVKKYCYDFMLP